MQKRRYANQKGNWQFGSGSLDKHVDQIDSIPSELISLIGLITENNSSSRNASQSTLAIAGSIVYSYKKGTHKRESTVDKASINQLRK